MQNRNVPRTIMLILFYLFAAGGLVATGLRTFSLLSLTTGSDLTAIFGLVMFEVGMLIWLGYARYGADNTPQRAIAIIASGLDLLLVLTATAADVVVETTLITIDKTFASSLVLYIIIAATVLNVAALWIAHVIESDILTPPEPPPVPSVPIRLSASNPLTNPTGVDNSGNGHHAYAADHDTPKGGLKPTAGAAAAPTNAGGGKKRA